MDSPEGAGGSPKEPEGARGNVAGSVRRKLIQLRDLARMRAHFGWGHFLLRKASRLPGPHVGAAERVIRRMERYTDRQKAEFDRLYGTETSLRCDVNVRDGAETPELRWGYSAISRDFLREILASIPEDLGRYTFVDIGSGKGAAVIHASEFPFQRLCGVELTAELLAIARRNVEKYNAATGRKRDVEWVHTDFFEWAIPNEPQLFFLNNPFPAPLTTPALQHIERSLDRHPRPALLVFRQAPRATAEYLNGSRRWQPVRLAPYWRVYRTS